MMTDIAPDGIDLHFGDIAAPDWDAVDADRPLPVQQHWAYGLAAAAMGGRVRQVTMTVHGRSVAIGLMGTRRIARLIQLSSLLRGPVWLPAAQVGPDRRAAIFKALAQTHPKHRWCFLAVQPDWPASNTADWDGDVDTGARGDAVLRRAGLRRVMSGFSTAWLDLRPDTDRLRAGLRQKWRNQLKKAEAARLQIAVGGTRAKQYDWLIAAEGAQQTARGYRALPTGFARAYAAAAATAPGTACGAGMLSVTAHLGGQKVAGALFLCHGTSATYHIGWTGAPGRAVSAQNRVLWEGCLALKDRGIRFLDLGGLDTGPLAGISRFKLGLGAAPVTLTGSWM